MCKQSVQGTLKAVLGREPTSCMIFLHVFIFKQTIFSEPDNETTDFKLTTLKSEVPSHPSVDLLERRRIMERNPGVSHD